jgi:hypothetical protein
MPVAEEILRKPEKEEKKRDYSCEAESKNYYV